MGITGLLPFLEKKTAKKVSLQEFSGGTAAVDTYCWLHKGVFTCADKLAMGVKTDGYVTYCMNYVNLLLKFKIKPILVFDGRHLPAKAETELKRREQRDANRKRATELMKMGEIEQGKNLLKRAIDVSHEMALNVIKKCQELNIDCIVAPYEADAQLAYLNISGIADFVITEDSDLTLFGCKKILFKMDKFGCGTLVEQERLYLSMALRQDDFTIEKFRHMCILSGCDYLPSLPGVGLAKALKFAQRNTDEDIYNALSRLSTHINKNITITKEYREAFVRALITFKHQLVYCPLIRKQVRLNTPPPEVTPEQLHHAGDPVDEDLAYQLALGNCNPFGFKKLNDFNPDNRLPSKKRTSGWHETPSDQYPSIWSNNFIIKAPARGPIPSDTTNWPNTVERDVLMNTKSIKRKISPLKQKIKSKNSTSNPLKRTSEHFNNELSKEDLFKLYENTKIMKNDDSKPEKVDTLSTPITSPRKFNPFLKKPACTDTSPSLVPRGRKRPKHTIIALYPTIVEETTVTESKFFSRSETSGEGREPLIIPETQEEFMSQVSRENLEKKMVKRNIIISNTQDELNSVNSKDDITKSYAIIPETVYNELDDETVCQAEEEVEEVRPERVNVIIPETMDEDEIFGENLRNEEIKKGVDAYSTPRNSLSEHNSNVIIPESPDEEELLLSQGSCKENDGNANIVRNDDRPSEKGHVLMRTDSGVDMKEDTLGTNLSPENFLFELEEHFSKIETRTSGLNIIVKKYGLKSPKKITRTPSPDDIEFFGASETVSSHRSSFFHWSNTKSSNRTVNFFNNKPSICSPKISSQSSRSKTSKRSQVLKKLPPIDSQQSKLNMYGFKRKDTANN
ncbi:exonuclease 1 [Fopius arisanus]|uniref:Exonuclease 1 n=1 Tax=Fopius arisanus TaxID=64838 RepID=A0A0C9RNG8_9HYME|nr:PREDICTED: exonuclease 1 [Fopius arisanus]XP_011300781.1 PREDICTED: exonuclease 1 [Fopius arisanus]